MALPLATPSALRPVLAYEPGWAETAGRFLAAVPAELRPPIERLLVRRDLGGCGLRLWLRKLCQESRDLPSPLPAELIEVYLRDTEAVPLHDCAVCGLCVPVRPHPRRAMDGDPVRVYFPSCPHCGGRTGLFAWWSRSSD